MRRSKEILDLVHTDIAGPFNVESVGQNRYFVLFIDDATRYVETYLLRHKSEVLAKFQEYKVKVENLHGRKIKVLRSDNGGEYTGNEFRDFCKQHGIEQQFTVPGTPEQNGTSERYVRTLTEGMHANLFQSNLPPSYWSMALKYATLIKNRTWTRKMGHKTPVEAWTGTKPSLADVHPFGCMAFKQISPNTEKKLKERATKVIYLGQRDGLSMGSITLNPATRHVEIALDLIFFENEFPG